MIQFLLDTTNSGSAFKDNWVLLVLLGVLLIVFMVLPIFTQKRNNKKFQEMIDKIHIGDEVKTIGGVVGKIIEIREISATEKHMVLETGAGENKSTIIFDMNAILNVVNPAAVPEVEEKQEEAKKD
ncbi:MAG TPA: preprotein translocase subunit YajC [Clostridia bacterium]